MISIDRTGGMGSVETDSPPYYKGLCLRRRKITRLRHVPGGKYCRLR